MQLSASTNPRTLMPSHRTQFSDTISPPSSRHSFTEGREPPIDCLDIVSIPLSGASMNIPSTTNSTPSAEILHNQILYRHTCTYRVATPRTPVPFPCVTTIIVYPVHRHQTPILLDPKLKSSPSVKTHTSLYRLTIILLMQPKL